jgi:hypothetical protein
VGGTEFIIGFEGSQAFPVQVVKFRLVFGRCQARTSAETPTRLLEVFCVFDYSLKTNFETVPHAGSGVHIPRFFQFIIYDLPVLRRHSFCVAHGAIKLTANNSI